MATVRPFVIALVASLIIMVGAGIAGNLIYGGGTPVRWTAGRISLAVLLAAGLLVFVYSLVPVVLRGFLLAQVKIGNGEAAAIQWALIHERGLRFAVWTIWTLGLLIAAPAAVSDWRGK